MPKWAQRSKLDFSRQRARFFPSPRFPGKELGVVYVPLKKPWKNKPGIVYLFGVGPQPKISYISEASARKMGLSKAIQQRAREIIESRKATGQKVFDAPRQRPKVTAVKGGFRVSARPSRYFRQIASSTVQTEAALTKKGYSKIRKLVHEGRLDQRFAQLFTTGGALTLLGSRGEYVVVQRRGTKTNFFPEMLHVLTGQMEARQRGNRLVFEHPHTGMKRELREEVRIPGKKTVVEVLGHDLNPIRAEKEPPLYIGRDLVSGSLEYQAVMRVSIPGMNTTQLLEQIRPNWEGKGFELIPNNPAAIRKFIDRNRGNISPTQLLGIEWYLRLLAKRGGKNK